jgi:membrane fusion protein (multidrug efflux system)
VVAAERVDLRARVQGFLKERHFTEGQAVKAGQVLFKIEPDQYRAVVEQREADLNKAEADELNARLQFKRGEELLRSNAIAQAKVDELRANATVAKASIAQAQAAVTAARLDLGYTDITAPIDGSIGLAKLSIGNLVGPDSGTLATLVQRDPIYVHFPVTQRQLLQHRKQVAEKGGDPKNVQVRARLADGSLYAETGRINFIDVTTDKGTDSVTLRAQFPNPNGLLVNGQYTGVQVESGSPELAILIPQSALQLDQQGTFVLVVDGENKAQVRRVTTGQAKGAEVIVKQGLKEGELVIAEGVQKVRPGQEVKAVHRQQAQGGGAR